MKLNRDYIIGAFIGGAAVSLLNVPRISSLKEDSAERQAQYVSKVQELDRQIRQAQNKDEIIELQRQQIELDKAEIDSLNINLNHVKALHLRTQEVLLVLNDRYSALWHLPIENNQLLYQKYGTLMNDKYGYWNMAEVYDVLNEMPYPWTGEGQTFHRERTKRYVL